MAEGSICRKCFHSYVCEQFNEHRDSDWDNKKCHFFNDHFVPAADVVEVKHGEWIEWWDDNYLSYCHKCSKCGGYPLTKEETTYDEVLSAYCPHCGAKMDGERRETE